MLTVDTLKFSPLRVLLFCEPIYNYIFKIFRLISNNLYNFVFTDAWATALFGDCHKTRQKTYDAK